MKIHRPDFISINDERGNLEGTFHHDASSLLNFIVQEVPSSTYIKAQNLLKEKVAVLRNINVFEKGKGYGNSLVQDFLEHCFQKDANHVVLVADLDEDQNDGFDLVKWYKSFGFEIIGDSYAGPFMILEL